MTMMIDYEAVEQALDDYARDMDALIAVMCMEWLYG